MRNLANVISSGKKLLSAGLVATSVAFPSLSEAEPREIFSRTFSVPMYDINNRHVKDTTLKITSKINEENGNLNINYETEGFNRTEWTDLEERVPVSLRYTNLLPPEIWISHHECIKVGNSKQNSYIVPQNTYVNLKSYDESRKAVPFFEAGVKVLELGLDWAGNKLGIENLGERFNNFVESKREERKQIRESNLKESGKDLTEIPHHYVDEFFGFTETARNYEIPIASKCDGNAEIKLWTRVDLNNSQAYGRLENTIEFTLNNINNSITEREIGWYFLNGDELKHIKTDKNKVPSVIREDKEFMERNFPKSNPFIMTRENMEKAANNPEEVKEVRDFFNSTGIISQGFAEYTIPRVQNREINLNWMVIEFLKEDDIKKYMVLINGLTEPLFVKGRFMIYNDGIEKIKENGLSDIQKIICINALEDFKTRTGANFVYIRRDKNLGDEAWANIIRLRDDLIIPMQMLNDLVR